MLDLQSHSTSPTGSCRPRRWWPPRRGGRHDARAHRPRRDRWGRGGGGGGAEAGDRPLVPATEISACTDGSMTCTCSATGWTRRDRARLRAGRSGSGSPARRGDRRALNAQGVPMRFEDAIAEAGRPPRSAAPTSPRPRDEADEMSAFFEEWLVPGRQGLRLAALADGLRGDRDHPRGGARGARPPLLGHGRPSEVAPVVRPRHRRDRASTRPTTGSRRSSCSSSARARRWPRRRPRIFTVPNHKMFDRFSARSDSRPRAPRAAAPKRAGPRRAARPGSAGALEQERTFPADSSGLWFSVSSDELGLSGSS